MRVSSTLDRKHLGAPARQSSRSPPLRDPRHRRLDRVQTLVRRSRTPPRIPDRIAELGAPCDQLLATPCQQQAAWSVPVFTGTNCISSAHRLAHPSASRREGVRLVALDVSLHVFRRLSFPYGRAFAHLRAPSNGPPARLLFRNVPAAAGQKGHTLVCAATSCATPALSAAPPHAAEKNAFLRIHSDE